QDDTRRTKRGGDRNQTLNKADGAKPLSEYPSGNQQHNYVSEGIGHAAISHFKAGKDFLRIKATNKLQNGGNQHTDNQNRDDVQMRGPCAVKDEHGKKWCERQNGVNRRSSGGDFADI